MFWRKCRFFKVWGGGGGGGGAGFGELSRVYYSVYTLNPKPLLQVGSSKAGSLLGPIVTRWILQELLKEMPTWV